MRPSCGHAASRDRIPESPAATTFRAPQDTVDFLDVDDQLAGGPLQAAKGQAVAWRKRCAVEGATAVRAGQQQRAYLAFAAHPQHLFLYEGGCPAWCVVGAAGAVV